MPPRPEGWHQLRASDEVRACNAGRRSRRSSDGGLRDVEDARRGYSAPRRRRIQQRRLAERAACWLLIPARPARLRRFVGTHPPSPTTALGFALGAPAAGGSRWVGVDSQGGWISGGATARARRRPCSPHLSLSALMGFFQSLPTSERVVKGGGCLRPCLRWQSIGGSTVGASSLRRAVELDQGIPQNLSHPKHAFCGEADQARHVAAAAAALRNSAGARLAATFAATTFTAAVAARALTSTTTATAAA